MNRPDFVVIGSGGGGGTISWLLAKAGFTVVLLEQGTDFARQAEDVATHFQNPDGGEPPTGMPAKFNPAVHDEYRFRLERPDSKRRLRGSYNTFRKSDAETAVPLKGMGGFTGSTLGGGSLLWGTWSFRALPIDLRLRTHFQELKQLELLEKTWGYSIPDWPISYSELEPYYNVTETMFAVCGDRKAVNHAVTSTAWYKEFSQYPHFRDSGNWEPNFPFMGPPYPLTPVGHLVAEGILRTGGNPVILPNSLVSPGSAPYQTKQAIAKALDAWKSADRPRFWQQDAEGLWSDRTRDACNLCGFCGEFLCWGSSGPKSSTRFTTLLELRDLPNAEIRTSAQAYEVVYDSQLRRATGVRYLNISDPDNPVPTFLQAQNVIVSCGAVQSARLLRMSGPTFGLGNRYDQLGRNLTFHLFGLGIKCLLAKKFQGELHAEFGHTGNVTSYDHYFLHDERPDAPAELKGKWCKGGTMASAAKKNPLENAYGLFRSSGAIGVPLLESMELYTRNVEVRLTGDDLPLPSNRVDLDPQHVDEYGLPVARITRNFGPHEDWMFKLLEPKMRAVFESFLDQGVIEKKEDIGFSKAIVDLFGDHQFGTCRMGDDPTTSVIDRFCRLHEAPNVFVVDSSFMPTGLGVNPMKTVVSNALRVGTWIVEQSKSGTELF